MLDSRGAVVLNCTFFVMLDFSGQVFFGVGVEFLRTLLVFETQLVEVAGITAL